MEGKKEERKVKKGRSMDEWMLRAHISDSNQPNYSDSIELPSNLSCSVLLHVVVLHIHTKEMRRDETSQYQNFEF